jgi:hypothetical protein
MGKIMTTDTTSTGTEKCVLETRPHIWDLGGTMEAKFADQSNPDEPVGFIDTNQTLLVTVTVTLTGRIKNYLCNTSLCMCLAFEACGPGSSGDFCKTIYLDGKDSPCQTDTWVFEFVVPPDTFSPGCCGREYTLCITLGSKDCCGKVGFVFGSCHDYKLTVSPAQTDGTPEAEADTAAAADTGSEAPALTG